MDEHTNKVKCPNCGQEIDVSIRLADPDGRPLDLLSPFSIPV